MNNREFKEFKNQFSSAIKQVLNDSEPGSLDESAFPAYVHPNPFINSLFWKRIHIAINYIERMKPFDLILDFGAGSGVLLPFLGQVGKKVIAFDSDPAPLMKMKKYFQFPDTISIAAINDFQLENGQHAVFDLIVALDVLEHIDNINQTAKWLYNLLKAGGQILFSGPTENSIYRIGRKIAGPRFSGNYHKNNINDVKNAFRLIADIKHINALYPVVTFFDFYTIEKKVESM